MTFTTALDDDGEICLIPVNFTPRRRRRSKPQMRYSDLLREAMEEHERLGKEIEMMKKLGPNKPKDDGPSFSIIQASMLMMLSAVPIGILDFILLSMILKK